MPREDDASQNKFDRVRHGRGVLVYVCVLDGGHGWMHGAFIFLGVILYAGAVLGLYRRSGISNGICFLPRCRHRLRGVCLRAARVGTDFSGGHHSVGPRFLYLQSFNVEHAFSVTLPRLRSKLFTHWCGDNGGG